MSVKRKPGARSAFGAPVAPPRALAEAEEEEVLADVQNAIKRFRRTPSVASTRARTPMTADPRYRRTGDKETPAKRKRAAAEDSGASVSRTSTTTLSRGLKRQRIASTASSATPLAASAVSRSRTAAKEELQSAKDKLQSAQLLAKIRTLESRVSELTQEQQSAAAAAAAAKRQAQDSATALEEAQNTIQTMLEEMNEREEAHQEAIEEANSVADRAVEEAERRAIRQPSDSSESDKVKKLRRALSSCQAELDSERKSYKLEIQQLKDLLHRSPAASAVPVLSSGSATWASPARATDEHVADLKARLKRMAAALEEAQGFESKFRVAESENNYLRAAMTSEEQLKEQVAQLQKSLTHVKSLLTSSTAQVESLTQYKAKLERWEQLLCTTTSVTGETVAVEEFQSSEGLEKHLMQTKRTIEVLAAEKGHLKAQISALELKVEHRDQVIEQLKEEVSVAQEKEKEAIRKSDVHEAWFGVLHREKQRNRLLLDTFSQEESDIRGELTSQEDLYLARVERLEKDLEETKTFIEKAISSGAVERTVGEFSMISSKEKDSPEENARLSMLQGMVDKLNEDKRELLEQLESCKARLGAGQMDPRTTKVLRLTERPPPTVSQRRAAASSQEAEKSLAEVEERYHALKKMAHKKIQWFRELVFSMLGWSIDFIPSKDPKEKMYRLRSFYHEPKTEKNILVVEKDDSFSLMETPFIADVDPNAIQELLEKGGMPFLLAQILIMVKDSEEEASA